MNGKLRLPETAAAWGTPTFAEALQRELRAHAAALPLQQALAHTSTALPETLEAMLIAAREDEGRLVLRVGLFFAGITGGCSCADDPTPVEPEPEYVEAEIGIDLSTAEARCALMG